MYGLKKGVELFKLSKLPKFEAITMQFLGLPSFFSHPYLDGHYLRNVKALRSKVVKTFKGVAYPIHANDLQLLTSTIAFPYLLLHVSFCNIEQ
jgi:hypothetical protein